MIKKLILGVFALVSLMSQAQTVTFDNGKTNKFWLPSADFTDCHIPFSNVSGSAIRLVYIKTKEDWPAQWNVTLCDNLNCYSSLVAQDTFATIAKSGKSDFKIAVYPNGHADTGSVSYVVFSAANPAVKDTFTAYFYVQWGAGVNSAEKEMIQVYPNPAAETLQVKSIAKGTAEITNVQGAMVQKSPIEAGSNTLNISALNKGIYFVSIVTSEGVLRKQIVKL